MVIIYQSVEKFLAPKQPIIAGQGRGRTLRVTSAWTFWAERFFAVLMCGLFFLAGVHFGTSGEYTKTLTLIDSELVDEEGRLAQETGVLPFLFKLDQTNAVTGTLTPAAQRTALLRILETGSKTENRLRAMYPLTQDTNTTLNAMLPVLEQLTLNTNACGELNAFLNKAFDPDGSARR